MRRFGGIFQAAMALLYPRVRKKDRAVSARSQIVLFSVLEDSPDSQNLSVACIGDDDSGLGVGSMHNLSVADIQRHMS